MRLTWTKTERSLSGGAPIAQAEAVFKDFNAEAAFLRTRANRYSESLKLREHTLSVIFPRCNSRDEVEQALTIGEWVQQHIKYVHEPRELFQSPFTTMRLGAGDCDDHATLICAMLGTVAIKNKMCFVQVRGKWIHIFAVALPKLSNGKFHRLTLDSTLSEPIRDMVNPIQKLKNEKGIIATTKFV